MQTASQAGRLSVESLPGWLLAAGLLTASALLGPVAGSAVRPLFIIGCGVVGYLAWRQGPAQHMQVLLVLFCFASLARRIVDLYAGFDSSGLMLVGPLLAMLVPAIYLLSDWTAGLRDIQALPMALVFGSVAYAALLTVFQGNWSDAASNTVKSIAPLAYAYSLVSARVSRSNIIDSATVAFLWILPLMGLYGIYQYIDPPEWDRFWMKSATILSAGQPVPYGVRTFSVLNGPASFATFTAAGLLMVYFLRPTFLGMILSIPAAVALMLSMYRTAWISLAVGIVFSLFFKATRGRGAGSIIGIAVMIGIVLMTPFGDAINERFASLSQGAGDGSARERIEEFLILWNRPDSGLIGNGFSTVDVGSAGSVAVDGMFMTCWLSMGMLVGLVCIAALLLAIGNAISVAWIDRQAPSIVIGALALGALTQMPLANLISGELGFLFWAFVVLLPSDVQLTPQRWDAYP